MVFEIFTEGMVAHCRLKIHEDETGNSGYEPGKKGSFLPVVPGINFSNNISVSNLLLYTGIAGSNLKNKK